MAPFGATTEAGGRTWQYTAFAGTAETVERLQNAAVALAETLTAKEHDLIVWRGVRPDDPADSENWCVRHGGREIRGGDVPILCCLW